MPISADLSHKWKPITLSLLAKRGVLGLVHFREANSRDNARAHERSPSVTPNVRFEDVGRRREGAGRRARPAGRNL